MSYVDEYLETLDASEKTELQRIRNIIHELAPEIEETKSYGMPAFKHKGKYVAGFSAYADHLSLFPTPEPIKAFNDELTQFKTSKGTIQFVLESPLPELLIKKIITHQLNTIDSKYKL
jgi:uncharacterized protein YdhG (YjbR/CyaY superfamily)